MTKLVNLPPTVRVEQVGPHPQVTKTMLCIDLLLLCIGASHAMKTRSNEKI